MTLQDVAKRITTSLTQPNRQAMFDNLNAKLQYVANKDLNTRKPGVQSIAGLRNIPAREWTPWTASRYPNQQPIGMPMQQFRGNTAQSLSLGTYRHNLPAPQGFAENVGAISGSVIGSLPIYGGINRVLSGTTGNLNRLPTLGKIGVGLTEGMIGMAATTPGTPKERLQTAYDYTLKPDPINLISAGLPVLAPALSQAKRARIGDIVDLTITQAKDQDQAIKRLNYLTDQLTTKGSTTPEYTQKLKALRASLNKKMFELGGVKTGNYKRDYALFQKGRKDPAVSQVIDAIETQITRIDDAILDAPSQLKRIDRTRLPQQMQTKTNEFIASKYELIPKTIAGNNKPSKYAGLVPDEFIVKPKAGTKVSIFDYLRTPDRVLGKIGLGKEAKQLRTAWGTYEKELPQEIDKVSEWYNRVGKNKESSKNIFLWLDGDKKIELSKVEQEVADEIKEYYKVWAKRLRLPEDKQISDYVTHIFAKDIIEKDFDEDIAKLIDQKVAKSVYDPFLQARIGVPSYKTDVFAALDAYVKRATRKANLDPVLTEIGKKAEDLDLSSWKYVKSYIDRVNMRPTDIDNLLDNQIKQMVGYKFGARPTTAITRQIRQWIYRGTLGLNAKSAIKNLTQGTNTYAELGEKYTAIGYLKSVKGLATGNDELKQVGVLSDSLIQDRQLNVKKRALETMDKGLFYFFDKAEQINRGAAYHGAKQKALDAGKSLDDAVDAGIDMARKTQFTFGNIDTPPILTSDIAKTVAQFSSYGVKQGEYLAEMVQSKDFPKMMRWIGANAVILYGIGDLLGMEPKDLIPSVRIGGSPFFTLAKDLGQTALNSPDQWGNQPDMGDRVDTLTNDLVPFLPGGVAIKRGLQGAKAYQQGYSTNRTGKVQYPIDQNPLNAFKSVVLGVNTTPEAIEYYKENRQPLSEKQTQLFKESMDRKFQYYQIMEKRKQDAMADQAKEMVKQTLQPAEAGGKYLYWDEESGEVKSVPLDRDIEIPELSGNELLDEKRVSRFKSAITSRTNDIVTLYELGKLTKEEAEAQLQELEELKDTFAKAKTKKGKKISIPKIKTPKASTIKITAPKASTLVIKPPKLKKPAQAKSLLNMTSSLTSYRPPKVNTAVKWEKTPSRKVTGIRV